MSVHLGLGCLGRRTGKARRHQLNGIEIDLAFNSRLLDRLDSAELHK